MEDDVDLGYNAIGTQSEFLSYMNWIARQKWSEALALIIQSLGLETDLVASPGGTVN